MDSLPLCVEDGIISFIPSVVLLSIPYLWLFYHVPNGKGTG